MRRLIRRLMELVPSKRLVRFGHQWVDADLPDPRPVNVFFGHVSQTDIQILLGATGFITGDVKAVSMLSLSPRKVKELRDFLTTVLQKYENRFGPVVPDSDPPDSPSTPPTIIH